MPRWPAVAVALLVTACGADDATVVSDVEPVRGAWEKVAESPLPDRVRTVMVWTGSEVIVVGGDRFSCPPSASCSAPVEPPLADGAAFDLETRTWRSIASAPVGFHSAASAVVVGDDVYLLANTDYASGSMLLRYSPSADEWAQVRPPASELDWHHLVAAGDRLVAYVGSEETGVTGDAVLDPETGEWDALPEDPMSTAFDRTMVWSAPHLYLFDKENVPNPGSERPSVVRAARLDLASGTWERLPDSEIIGGGPWLVDGDRLVNPLLGGADGGEVNGWGRTYPNGGVFDMASSSWLELPDGPDGALGSAGAVGESSAVFFGTHGPVLDVVSGRWTELDGIPGVDEQESTFVVAAGRGAVAFASNALWRHDFSPSESDPAADS